MNTEHIAPIAITADPGCGEGAALAISVPFIADIGSLPRRASNSNDIWTSIYC
jgi:hypothetical protein